MKRLDIISVVRRHGIAGAIANFNRVDISVYFGNDGFNIIKAEEDLTFFRNKNLRKAIFYKCDLRDIDFRGVDMTGVNLEGVIFHNSIGDGKRIRNMYVAGENVIFFDGILQIGFDVGKKIKDWKKITHSELKYLNIDVDWWEKYSKILFTFFTAVRKRDLKHDR
jgi:uncharacterized protein YjbI with pentapeptide repeats